jgi:hypothetical protein
MIIISSFILHTDKLLRIIENKTCLSDILLPGLAFDFCQWKSVKIVRNWLIRSIIHWKPSGESHHIICGRSQILAKELVKSITKSTFMFFWINSTTDQETAGTDLFSPISRAESSIRRLPTTRFNCGVISVVVTNFQYFHQNE